MDQLAAAERIGILKGMLTRVSAERDHYRSETMALRKERRELKRKIRELRAPRR